MKTFFIVILILFLAVYFLPTLIAVCRAKRNIGAIFALNLFLGWSFIGWVAAFILAVMPDFDKIDKNNDKT